MSRATAVQALIDEWNAEVREHGLWTSGHCIAAKMAALLLREGQEPPAARLHELAIIGARKAHNAGTEAAGHVFPYKFETCPHPDCVLVRQPAGLREGPPAPPGHAAAAPYTEPEQALDPGIRCAVRMLRKAGFETTDSGDGVSKPADERTFEVPHVIALAAATTMCAEAERMASILGAGWMVQASYATDDKTCVLLATFLAASQTGAAPQEAIPDHCENCRAEMPLTTVHLCHACLPSAPREHAGEAPATEPESSWRCFHCNMVLRTEQLAREHFGVTRHDIRACDALTHPAVQQLTFQHWHTIKHWRDMLSDVVDACYAEGTSAHWRLCGVCQMEHHREAVLGDQTHVKGCVVDSAERLLRAWSTLAASQAGTASREADVAQMKTILQAADTEVEALNNGKKWRMSIPARMDDSDLTITTGLNVARELLKAAAHGAVPPE